MPSPASLEQQYKPGALAFLNHEQMMTAEVAANLVGGWLGGWLAYCRPCVDSQAAAVGMRPGAWAAEDVRPGG
jgi:hypothetical protein